MVSESLVVAVPRTPRWRRGYWRLTGAMVLQMLAVSVALIGLIQGAAWWVALMSTSCLLLVAGAGLRTLGVHRGLVPVFEIVVGAMVMSALFGGRTGLFGIIPTPTTAVQWESTFQQAILSISQQGTPAESRPEFLFLVVGGALLIAIILDTLAVALRAPAFTAAGVEAVLVVPGALLGDGLDPRALALSALAYLWLLRADVRTRRPGSPRLGAALAIGVSATLIAMMVATTAPGFDRGSAVFTAGGSTIGDTVTPLIDLGKDLRRPTAVRALTYTTNAVTGQYLTLASLDQFTGSVWKRRERDTTRLIEGVPIGPVAGLSDQVMTSTVTTSVTIDTVQSRWLPVPAPARSVKGLTGVWAWDPDDLTIGGVGTTTRGQRYTVTSVRVQPTADQLREAGGVVPEDVQRELFLPPDTPPIIHQTALAATAGALSEYEQAVALQDYFRNNGFVYSVRTPLKQGYDGDGARVIAAFLDAKSGYCVHFASAMAVMARSVGIPSRVVEGYLPGDSGGSAASPGEYTVTSDDLHAWPELYFAGVGWVSFEPTVGRGTVPGYTRPEAAVTAPTTAPDSGVTTAPRRLVPTDPAQVAGARGASTASPLQPVLSGLGGALLIVLVVVAPAAARRVRRHRRVRRLAEASGGVGIAWAELRDTMRDLGWGAPTTETPRFFAHRVAEEIAGTPGEGAVLRLLDVRERDAYGPPRRGAVVGLSGDLVRVLGALESRAGRGRRVRAFLVPVSLVPAGWPNTARPGSAA